jgi:DNA-binding response OmpR family regulator
VIFFHKACKKLAAMRFLPAARIVVLDADARHREDICAGLSDLGLIQVLAAGTLPDAKAFAHERPIDLAVVDMRGFQDLAREQGKKILPNPFIAEGTPVILLASDTSRAMVHEAHAAGYRAVVSLPVSARLLYRRIGSILQKTRRSHRRGGAHDLSARSAGN